MDYQVGIIGAGFAGIIAGINLLKSGRNSFIIFEKCNEPGGVWRDNIYPGCTCDIRSNLYSIKSEPNPNWSGSYPHQNEIFKYLKQIVKKYNLVSHIHYETKIIEMTFMESGGYWLVKDNQNKSLTIKMIILATGPFCSPKIPEIPGLETFSGSHFHSASWDNSVDLTGLNVAIIGTGASSIQIVPNIAKQVSSLFIFQRSAAWILPRFGSKNSILIKWLYKKFPIIQKIYRETNYWFLEFIGLSFLGNRKMHRFLQKIALNKIKNQVINPVIQKRLIPGYSFGCKRVLVSDDYYPAFNRTNVTLVTDAIDEIKENKICTNNGEQFPVDIIIHATGFTVADAKNYIKIIGRGKNYLNSEWDRNGPEAYLGTTISGYPNLCFLLGPNSGLSYSSALHIIESQLTYILQYISEIERNGNTCFLDVKLESQRKHNLKLQEKLSHTIWSSGCNSWFVNKKGKNIVINPQLTFQFRKSLRVLNKDHYSIIK